MIRHLVALKFADETPIAAKDAIFDDLRGLGAQLEGFVDFQSRTNTSPETNLVRGFKDLFWFDFTNNTARDAYLINSNHQAIGARIVAACEGGADGIFVIDFEA